MMRKSGSSPVVKRSKFCWVMLRRAASGHIEATQFGKFAAAWRIALAVIRGWPEAPSSPLQGGGAPSGPVAACGCGADFWPEKMLPKKFETPLPPCDCAKASLENKASLKNKAWPENSSAATKMAPARWLTDGAVKRMLCPFAPKIPFQKALSRFPIA